MKLQELSISEPKIKQFTRAGISTVESLLHYFPKNYLCRTQLTGILPASSESVILVIPQQVRITYARVDVIRAVCKEVSTGTEINVTWFNQAYLYAAIRAMQGKTVLACGKIVKKNNEYLKKDVYELNAPAVFSEKGAAGMGIYPIYKKIPGMSDEYLADSLAKAFSAINEVPETVPADVLHRQNLIDRAAMLRQLHFPQSTELLDAAIRRRRWDELLYFALRIELANRSASPGSPYNLPILHTMHAVKNTLQFHLTADQENALSSMLSHIQSGRRLNALLQGDVGCGKTIVALLLMLAFAENGYQAAIMAPTQILAAQHYKDLLALTSGLGIPTVCIAGTKLKKKEQAELEQSLASGQYKLIVGTQALLSENYTFKNLALVVEDEEHKYGVEQRENLIRKAATGTHTVTMSATPIPRSLAQTVYGDSLQLYSIHTMPQGRHPIKTGIAVSMDRVYHFLLAEIKQKGHQAYAVCPMISKNEKLEGVQSVEEVYEQYQTALSPFGIRVCAVTGKTKKEDAQQIFSDFRSGAIDLLVSTTVIEVGVNVPNATAIIIHNAERFGLAQLHQLRGRVGRGTAPGVCVLVSEDKKNTRLEAMCNHTDGFEIAQMDLQMRGAGDFLGNRQSGTERYLAQALEYSKEYEQAQKEARYLLSNGIDCAVWRQAAQDYADNRSGEMLT